MREALNPSYGSQVWESGDERILVVRTPLAEPDLVNDLEAAVEYLSPRDLTCKTVLLVGSSQSLAVAPQPLRDLMAARMATDKRICAKLRPSLDEPRLLRAPEDPQRLLRILVPLPRRLVKDLQDEDLDDLAQDLAAHTGDQEWRRARAVHLVAGEDDVRIEPELFWQDITERLKRTEAATQTNEADSPDDVPPQEHADEPSDALPQVAETAAQRVQPSPVHRPASSRLREDRAPPPLPARRAPMDLTLPEAFTPPPPRAPSSVPRSDALPESVSDAERRALLSELGRRYGRGVAVAPLRSAPEAASWEAPPRADLAELSATLERLAQRTQAHPATRAVAAASAPSTAPSAPSATLQAQALAATAAAPAPPPTQRPATDVLVDTIEAVEEPPTPEETALAQLRTRLQACGFDVLLHPTTPGHAVDLAAERAAAYPTRVVAWSLPRLTAQETPTLLATSRALEVDLALVVASDADAESRKQLIATKLKLVAPAELADFRL